MSRVCSFCRQPASGSFLTCTSCLSVGYCGPTCQASDSRRHGGQCKLLASLLLSRTCEACHVHSLRDIRSVGRTAVEVIMALTWTIRGTPEVDAMHVYAVFAWGNAVPLPGEGPEDPEEDEEKVVEALRRAVTEIEWPKRADGDEQYEQGVWTEARMLVLEILVYRGKVWEAVKVAKDKHKGVEGGGAPAAFKVVWTAYVAKWYGQAAMEFGTHTDEKLAAAADFKALAWKTVAAVQADSAWRSSWERMIEEVVGVMTGIAFELSEFALCVSLCRPLLQHSTKSTRAEMFQVSLRMTEALMCAGDLGEAQKAAEHCIESAKEEEDGNVRRDAHRLMALIERQCGKLEAALQHARHASLLSWMPTSPSRRDFRQPQQPGPQAPPPSHESPLPASPCCHHPHVHGHGHGYPHHLHPRDGSGASDEYAGVRAAVQRHGAFAAEFLEADLLEDMGRLEEALAVDRRNKKVMRSHSETALVRRAEIMLVAGDVDTGEEILWAVRNLHKRERDAVGPLVKCALPPAYARRYTRALQLLLVVLLAKRQNTREKGEMEDPADVEKLNEVATDFMSMNKELDDMRESAISEAQALARQERLRRRQGRDATEEKDEDGWGLGLKSPSCRKGGGGKGGRKARKKGGKGRHKGKERAKAGVQAPTDPRGVETTSEPFTLVASGGLSAVMTVEPAYIAQVLKCLRIRDGRLEGGGEADALIGAGAVQQEEDGFGNGDGGAVGAADVVEEDDPLCLICLEDDDEDDQEEVVTLACQHRYHSTCLDAWTCACQRKALDASCPKCRGPMNRL